jgi:hypothetical protein
VTIRIRNQALDVEDGHVGTPDPRVIAHSDTWLGFVARERSLGGAAARQEPPEGLAATPACIRRLLSS